MAINSSDFALSNYTYFKKNAQDLRKFSIKREVKCTIPFVNDAMVYAKDLKMAVAPWSPPRHMKTNDNMNLIKLYNTGDVNMNKANKIPFVNNNAIMRGITPSMRYDGSMPFEVWQKEARNKLSELMGMDKFQKCDPDFRIRDGSCRCGDRYAYIAYRRACYRCRLRFRI
jgi:hypothetical protein